MFQLPSTRPALIAEANCVSAVTETVYMYKDTPPLFVPGGHVLLALAQDPSYCSVGYWTAIAWEQSALRNGNLFQWEPFCLPPSSKTE